MDIHAGAFETSWMLQSYTDLVNADIAKELTPTELDFNKLKEWTHGGSKARSLTPRGYLGNPANMDLDKMKAIEPIIIDSYSRAIMEILKENRQ